MVATAVRLQIQACEILVKHAAAVAEGGRQEEFIRTVMEVIGEVAPEMQRAVVIRLRDLREQAPVARFGLAG